MTWPIPPSESQVSTVDSDGCVSFATTHAIESQRIFHGEDTEYSERWLAKMSGTSLQGNFVTTVFQTVKDKGMVPESLWPEVFPFTWGEFYADIPQPIIDAGKDFLSKYDVTFENDIPLANKGAALQKGPVLAVLQGPGMNHLVTLLDDDLIIDSYPHSHDANGVINYTEKLSDLETHGVTIQSLHQILITPKNMAQLFTKTANIDGEIGVFVSTDEPSGLALLNGLFNKNLAADPSGNIATDIVAHKQ